ncbi:peptidase C14 [Streptomyces sp. Mg1]|nr:peptidase C14 [Streptomyces sp. Mg1]
MSETGTESETPEEIRGTALGVVVENYQSGRFRQLTGATEQMRELCELLEERGYGTTVVEDPECSAVNKPLGDWARSWRATGGHGPAVVLWSGHGVLDDGELRLIVRDTVDPEFDGEVHSANLLASTASLSGADQVLLLIDTCHAGAGVVPSLEKALGRLSQRNLPPGRWAWFGVIASCRPQEKAEAGGVLLDAFARVLREGPRTDEYRHEWSRRNGQVSGNTVIQAVLAEWPAEVGHRPLNAMTGRDRLMFANPLRAAATEPELVEHLVQAARGAAPDDEGWFFSGRRRVLGEITEWLEARRPGLFLVTGSAGSGKSAVLGRIATLSDPAHPGGTFLGPTSRFNPAGPGPRARDSVDVAPAPAGLHGAAAGGGHRPPAVTPPPPDPGGPDRGGREGLARIPPPPRPGPGRPRRGGPGPGAPGRGTAPRPAEPPVLRPAGLPGPAVPAPAGTGRVPGPGGEPHPGYPGAGGRPGRRERHRARYPGVLPPATAGADPSNGGRHDRRRARRAPGIAQQRRIPLRQDGDRLGDQAALHHRCGGLGLGGGHPVLDQRRLHRGPEGRPEARAGRWCPSARGRASADGARLERPERHAGPGRVGGDSLRTRPGGRLRVRPGGRGLAAQRVRPLRGGGQRRHPGGLPAVPPGVRRPPSARLGAFGRGIPRGTGSGGSPAWADLRRHGEREREPLPASVIGGARGHGRRAGNLNGP